MKIISENKYKLADGQIDYMAMISDFQDEYGEVYWNTIDGQIFIYRSLGRKEFKQIVKADISDIEKEDTVCQACLLYPKNFDFDEVAAGIPTELFKNILKNSFLDSLDSKKLVIAYHRHEMQEFDNQMTCIISEAFPNISIEDIEEWDMAKTAKYLSRAEWKLNILRQVPIDYETSDKLLEEDWYNLHKKEGEEEAVAQPQQEKVSTPNKPLDFKVETLEERQARLASQSQPRRKTSEEEAEFKRMFPELAWQSEVDNPIKEMTNGLSNVDTISPALRTR